MYRVVVPDGVQSFTIRPSDSVVPELPSILTVKLVVLFPRALMWMSGALTVDSVTSSSLMVS